MIPFENVERLIGNEAGCVWLLGNEKEVQVYLDTSLKRFPIVYSACRKIKSQEC